MRVDKLGTVPAAMLTIGSLAVTLALGYASGVRPPTTQQAVSDVAPAAEAPAILAAVRTPAHETITAVLGADIVWGAKLPAPFGCVADSGIASASTRDGVTMHAFHAGLGTAALRAIRCGKSTTVNGAPAVRMTATGGTILAWLRGDVIVTVSAADLDPAKVNDLDARLVTALTGACANLAPTADDAARNPVSDDYAGWNVAREVSITPLKRTPSALDGVPIAPLSDLTIPAMPAGIAGPPLPIAVAKPTAPADPGPEPTSTTITVAQADPTGPGCGWAFTGQRAAKVDAKALQSAAADAAKAARTDLLTRQSQWATATTTFQSGLALYITDAAAWNAYAESANAVLDQWRTQKASLDTYNKALKAYNDSVAVRDEFVARQNASRAEYEATVAACAAPHVTAAPTPSPTPTVTPTATPTASAPPTPSLAPAPACPPQRPEILDQDAPPVALNPTPPTLWSPSE